MAATLDLGLFETSDPHVLKKDCDLDKVYFRDLHYGSRLKALLSVTRDAGHPIFDGTLFNDLLNGRRTLAYVMGFTSNRQKETA